MRQTVYSAAGNGITDFSHTLDILSAALDGGLAISILLIFFCLQYPRNGAIGENTIQVWWGNTVFNRTADAASSPYYALAPGATFG